MRVAIAVGAAGLAAVAIFWSIGSNAAGDGRWRTVASRGHGYSLALPIGWRRSPSRLVPKLLMPREVVSAGNFDMAVGGGGNCGREPLAAIGRMHPGDALVSVQEYRVGAGLRPHLTRNFPPGPARPGVGQYRHSPLRGAAGTAIVAATIPFSEGGRAFDALVYIAGAPTPAKRRLLDGILARLRFTAPSAARS